MKPTEAPCSAKTLVILCTRGTVKLSPSRCETVAHQGGFLCWWSHGGPQCSGDIHRCRELGHRGHMVCEPSRAIFSAQVELLMCSCSRLQSWAPRRSGAP